MKMRSRKLSFLLGALLLALAPIKIAYATDPIVLDSNFTDWAGELSQSDASGDQSNASYDIVLFSWADNAGDSNTYFMVQRVGSTKNVWYWLYIDTNNNGVYNETVDRLVKVSYTPGGNGSIVDLYVYNGVGGTISSLTGQDWGQTNGEGGTMVEFRVSFSDLGISVGQTIRMYVESHSSTTNTTVQDRAPDSGDIQWSPVDILGYPLLGAAVIIVALLIWRCEGRLQWKRYYSR